MAGLDVARSVAARRSSGHGRGFAPETSSPRSSAFLVSSVRSRRVRAVAAEGEVAVEVGARQLDVRGLLDVAGGEAEQDPVLDQPVEQLHHPVLDHEAGGVLDLIGQVVQAAAHQGFGLLLGRLASDRLPEDHAPHLGIGHPLAGHGRDVDVNALQLLEGALPGAVAGAAACRSACRRCRRGRPASRPRASGSRGLEHRPADGVGRAADVLLARPPVADRDADRRPAAPACCRQPAGPVLLDPLNRVRASARLTRRRRPRPAPG